MQYVSVVKVDKDRFHRASLIPRNAVRTIQEEKRWCQCQMALSEDGQEVYPGDELSYKWCASGAIEKEFGDSFPQLVAGFKVSNMQFIVESFQIAYQYLIAAINGQTIDEFVGDPDLSIILEYNDAKGRTHQEVVNKFRKAIDMVEKDIEEKRWWD